MTKKKPEGSTPARVRKEKAQPAAEAVTAPLAPPEPSDAEIAEALDGLEVYDSDDEDRYDDLMDDLQDEREEYDPESVGVVQEKAEVRPPVHLVPASASTLLAHCGTRKITRDELALVPTPEATRTHQPVAHSRVVEALVEALAFRHIGVMREEYAVTPDGGKMFGVLDLDYEFSTLDTFRFSIGLRNSNDKTMRLGVTIGYRVLVCDNMAFKGDFTPVLAKHSRRLDLEEVIALGVDRMQRGFTPLKRQIDEWQQREITSERAKLLIYDAFVDRALPLPKHLLSVVHRHYFRPGYEAFAPRTLWSLSNAFTSAFKGLKPVRQFQATAKLGEFMTRGGKSLANDFMPPAAREGTALLAHA